MGPQIKGNRLPSPGHNPSAHSSQRRRRRFSQRQTVAILAAPSPALLGSVAMDTDVEVPIVKWRNINRESEVPVLGSVMRRLVSMDGKSVDAKFIRRITVDNTSDPNVTPSTGVAQVCNSYSSMLTR
jgi:hypothetical protein